MKKKLIYIEGMVLDIFPSQEYKRGEKVFTRATFSFITEDNQLVFLEIRDSVLRRFRALGIEISDRLSVGFYFDGSQKKDKRFNNIVVQELNYLS